MTLTTILVSIKEYTWSGIKNLGTTLNKFIKFFGQVLESIQRGFIASTERDWITPLYCVAFFYAWVQHAANPHITYNLQDLSGWYVSSRSALMIHYTVDSGLNSKVSEPVATPLTLTLPLVSPMHKDVK